MSGPSPVAVRVAAAAAAPPAPRKTSVPEKKYRCQFCNVAFSRSEHRSRHERSHTKERPFRCVKCRANFVRRDLLLRHDRTVHAEDRVAPPGGDVKRRNHHHHHQLAPQAPPTQAAPPDNATFQQVEADSDGMVDIETAAMLMTDFQHKAMLSQERDFGLSRDHLAPPSAPPFFEPPISAVNGTIGHGDHVALPQMPWDTLVPQTVNGHKHHSISSSGGASQDTGPSFSSASTNHGQLPTILEKPPSDGETLRAHDPLSAAPTSAPGLASSATLSPYLGMMGPVSPVDYRRSPGPSQPLSTPNVPRLESDEDCLRVLDNIGRCDGELVLVETFRLPSRSILNRYLSTYFNLFHHHLPFLHQPSFRPTSTSAPLLLAVLSIGALYTFEMEQAYMLHIGSKNLVSQFLQKKENFSSRKCPLWAMQSTLLNMIFASWSGDPKGLEWACSIKSLLANMVAGNRYELNIRQEGRGGSSPSHEEWIEDEGCRRTYYAVYIFFSLLTLTYNHTPAIAFNEFDTLDLPSSESLWNLEASDEESWRESSTASTIVSFREAHDRLFQGEAARYSAFATRVLISALFLGVWYHKRSPEVLQDVVTEYKLRLALETWQNSLQFCEPETVVAQLGAPDEGHPLIFNAKAMYRNTRARLLVDLKAVQEALRYHDSFEVAATMAASRDKVKRSQHMIEIIQECFDCLEVPAAQGIRWVARTSATKWSVEHPLCGLDLMVILSLWLYRLEHDEEPADEEEMTMYNKIRALFDEDSLTNIGSKLSATVARMWGSIFDEVVVWGITRIMGESFKLHAHALVGYEDSVAHGSGVPSPSVNSGGKVAALELQTAY